MTTLDHLLDTEQTAPARPVKYRGRHRKSWLHNRPLTFGLGAIVALFTVACGAAPADEPVSEGQPGQVVETVAPAKTPKAKSTPKSWGDGDYEVGKDIPPGQYATRAGDDAIACTWQRLKAFDGATGSYIAVGIVDQGATGRMVVKKSDYGISFAGGCNWAAVKS